MNYTTSKSLKLRENNYILILIIAMFHILRNVSLLSYLFLFFSVCIIFLIKNFFLIFSCKINIYYLPFIFSFLLLPIISVFFINDINNVDKYFYISSRYFICATLLLFTLVLKNVNLEFLLKIIKYFCLIVSFASVTLIVQTVLAKPISWFAASGYRDGLPAYATFIGNRDSFGICTSCCFLFLLLFDNMLFNFFVKNALIILNIIGFSISLGKSSFINLFLVLFIFIMNNLFLNKGKKRILNIKKTLKVLFIITIIILFIKDIKFFSGYSLEEYFIKIFNYVVTHVDSDMKVRLNGKNFTKQTLKFSYCDFFFGKGLWGLGCILGIPGIATNNNYYDLFFSGGLFFLSGFFILIIHIFYNIWRCSRKKNMVKKLAYIRLSLIILLLVNMFIGQATFFQPIVFVAWLIVLFLMENISKFFEKSLGGE